MAVVQKFLQGYPDPATYKQPEAIYRGNPMRAITGLATIANGDSATSAIMIGKIASHAIILPNGLITHTAITGLSDFDLGILEDADCLLDGVSLASAGTKNPVASVATANLLKPLWQLAGLSFDPGREFELVASLKADAGADGTIHFFIPYIGKL